VTLTITSRKLSDLRHYPGNARKGDVEAIRDSLRRNGQFRPLLVQESTGYVLTGNHTMDGMLAEGWTEADVTVLDVDDDAARRIVIADNRTSDLGSYDERALVALLRDLGEDLEGTGYELDDFDALLAALEEDDADHPPQEPTALVPVGETGTAPAAGTVVRQPPTSADYDDGYTSRDTRFLALTFPPAQYAWVVEHLAKLAADRGLDSAPVLLLHLLSDATGQDWPPEDATISVEALTAAETIAERATAPASPLTPAPPAVLPTEAQVASARQEGM
jgi:hypothetical protein